MIRITLTETAKKIIPKLRKYWDDDEYVEGVIINAKNDDNLNIISDFIDYAENIGDEITADHISALALSLGNKEKNKND
ncbi:MAG: hypothetical protein ACI39G_05820 [Pseudoramibacter sp.]